MKTNIAHRILRPLKILAIVVGAVTVLAATVLYSLIATANTHDGRERIAWIASRLLHRDVHIEGRIQVDLSLRPRIVVEDLAISNPNWAHHPLFLSAKRLEAKVAILPLLVRRLDISEVRATEARLWLERRADGMATWRFGKWFKQKSVRSATVEHAHITFRTAKGMEIPADVSEASLASDRLVRLYARGQYRGLPAAIELHGGALNEPQTPGAHWPLKGRATLGDSTLTLDGNVTRLSPPLRADLRFEASGASLTTFEALLGRRTLKGGQYHAEAQLRADDSGYSVRLAASVSRLTALSSTNNNARHRITVTAGRIDGRLAAMGQRVSDLMRHGHWRLFVSHGAVRWIKPGSGSPLVLTIREGNATSDGEGSIRSDVDGAFNRLPFRAHADFGPLSRTKSIPLRASVAAEGLSSDFTGALRRSVGAGRFEGDVRVHMDNLGRLGRLVQGRWPAIGPVQLSAHLAGMTSSLHATKVSANIDRSQLNGRFDLNPRATPTIGLVIAGGEIDIADVEKAAALFPKESKQRIDGKEKRVIPATPLPANPVRRFDALLDIERLRFVSGGNVAGEIEGEGKASKGHLSVRLSAGKTLASGITSIKARLTMNTALGTPLVNVHVDVDHLDYGALLQRLRLSDKVRGTLDAHMNVTGRGDTLREILSRAEGDATFVGGEGRIPRHLLELWGGGVFRALMGAFGGGNQMRLNCAAGRFTIGEHALKSDRLVVDTANITIGGDLALDLSTEEVNGLFRSRSKQATILKLGRPVQLSGTLAEPKARLAGSRIVEMGKLMLGLADPLFLLLFYSELPTGEQNPCAAVLSETNKNR